MANNSSLLKSIKYTRGQHFQVLDQLRVPQELVYRDITGVSDGVDSIKTMQVRGAPLIAMVGCLSIAVEVEKREFKSGEEFLKWTEQQVQALVDARPTAVNMKREGNRLIQFVGQQIAGSKDLTEIKNNVLNWIEDLLKVDYETNKAIGDFGAEEILKTAQNTLDGKVNVLTHCNTGSLATSGYGTALGVVRSLFKMGNLSEFADKVELMLLQ